MCKIKKIFFPKIQHYGYDLKKTWYVYFDVPSYNGLVWNRKCLHGNLNKYLTVKDRLDAAALVIAKVYKLFDKQTGQPIVQQSICPLQRALEFKKCKFRTKQSYESKIRILKDYLESVPVQKMTIQQANEFMQKQLYKSGTTYNNYLESYCALFNDATNMNFLKNNPFKNIKKVKESPQSKKPFTINQITYLKGVILDKNPQLWFSCQLLYYCFIRPKEQRFLCVGDIDFQNYKILMRGDISKNGKTQWVNIPKPFRPQIDALQNYTLTNYIFTKHGIPGPILTPVNYLNNQHKKFMVKPLFTLEYSLYSWKHTGAIAAVKSGINVKELQLQLRHSSLDEVNEYLKNMGVDDCEGIINLFPKI